jgi:hypothetical protein
LRNHAGTALGVIIGLVTAAELFNCSIGRSEKRISTAVSPVPTF